MISLLSNKKNQLFLIIVLLILLTLGVIFFIYQNNSNLSSCFNGIQDSDEEGVDCGGVCVRKCPDYDELLVNWAKIISDDKNNNHQLVALVTNPNKLYGASNFSYEFIGIKEDGEEVFHYQGEGFVLPGQEKYIIKPGIKELNGAKSVEIKITNLVWKRFFAYKSPTLLIVNKQIIPVSGMDYSLEVSGRLINDSIYNLRTVNLSAVIFDKNNLPIGTNSTYLGSVRSREKRDFRLFWKKDIQVDEIGYVDLKAETNIFQEDAFMKDYQYEGVEEVR